MKGRFTMGVSAVWLAAVLIVACEPIVVPPADQRAVEAPRTIQARTIQAAFALPPVIVDDVIAYEGDGRAVVPVRLREVSDTLTRLRYYTRSGTAVHHDPQGTEAERTGPFDFHRISDGQLPMQAGLVESQFVIPIRNDNLVEDAETFTVVVEPRCWSWETCPEWQVEATVTIRDGYSRDNPSDGDGGNPAAPPRACPYDAREGEVCGSACGGEYRDPNTGELVRGDCSENDPTRAQMILVMKDDCRLVCVVP